MIAEEIRYRSRYRKRSTQSHKGIDVVCLEAGGRLAYADIVNDPPLMNRRMGWHDERRGVGVSLCKTVGGTTMRWSGVCPRLLAYEFRARTTYGAMDDTTLIDWPITLEELEPYYDKAEVNMGVSGTSCCRNRTCSRTGWPTLLVISARSCRGLSIHTEGPGRRASFGTSIGTIRDAASRAAISWNFAV